MEIKKFLNDNFKDCMNDAIFNKKEVLYYGSSNKTLVLSCNNNLTNIKFCQKNEIEVFCVPNVGSTIVAFAGDFEIAYFCKTDDNFLDNFVKNLTNLLVSKGFDATFDGNDVLIDKKFKVCAVAKSVVNQIYYTAIHVSMMVETDLIDKICLKKREKEPKGLLDFGVSREEIEKLILETKGG